MTSCQKNQNLKGNYSYCYNGQYTEIYFKKDSVKVANENEWIRLTEWHEMKLEGDTIQFLSFGEWKDSVEFIFKNIDGNLELNRLDDGVKLYLKSIEETIDFENEEDFWTLFSSRQIKNNCTN